MASGVLLAVGVALLQLAGQEINGSSVWQAALGVVLAGLALRRILPKGRPLKAVWRCGCHSRIVLRHRGVSAGDAGAAAWTRPAVGGGVHHGRVSAGCWVRGSRPGHLRLPRDRIIVAGTFLVSTDWDVALGAWFSDWTFSSVAGITVAGVGMGLQQASTSLATMQLSVEGELGHNTSALQVGEALGGSVLAGLAGTLFAWWLPSGDLVVMFAAPATAMLVSSLAAIWSAFYIGFVENQSAA